MKKHMGKTVLFLLVPVALVGGCAVAPLTDAGASVRVISDNEAKNCQFLNSVSANNQNTLSKDPETDAKNRAKNQVAELGGNALLIKTTQMQGSSSGIGGVFSLRGDAYRCK